MSATTSAAKNASKLSNGAPASNGEYAIPYASGSTSRSTSANAAFGASSSSSAVMSIADPSSATSAVVMYSLSVGMRFAGRSVGIAVYLPNVEALIHK